MNVNSGGKGALINPAPSAQYEPLGHWCLYHPIDLIMYAPDCNYLQYKTKWTINHAQIKVMLFGLLVSSHSLVSPLTMR